MIIRQRHPNASCAGHGLQTKHGGCRMLRTSCGLNMLSDGARWWCVGGKNGVRAVVSDDLVVQK